MAKYFSSLCCCSCCSSISPSLLQSPQQEAIAGLPTTSSPSQPSEQETIAGPSTATITDFKSFLHKFNDISQLHGLIQFLEELLKIASGEKSEGGSNSAVGSYIQDGQEILEMLYKRIGKRPQKKDSMDSTTAEIEKVVIDLLKNTEKIPSVGIALSVLGSVLARHSQVSENKSECLEVLRRMLNLGKQILELKDQIPDQKLNEAVQCIVVGSTMCTSLLARPNILRFLTAPVNAESLKGFHIKIDRLISEVQFLTLNEIAKRVPKIASQSQKLYAYQTAVGIESGLEKVIQLLDLNAQDAIPIVVVVYGFGGIGKTTLADAVYAHINLQAYKHFRIHMDQNCTKNDLKVLQEQILNRLFHQNMKLTDCDHGRGMIWSCFKENHNQPLFLYIDNGLKSTDLEQLLPEGLGSCLPPKSRILVTTRNLQETEIFVGRDIQRQQYAVSPLPETEAREILLKKVSDYNDEENIQKLLELCGGVPLLLELAGSQVAINTRNPNKIVLEMLREGKKVKERDISDRMVDFVYGRLLEPVQEAFLDITSFFYDDWSSEYVANIVGEEEFKVLEDASFIKTSESGLVIVHDIVQARGKKLSEQEGNRITDPERLLECLKDEEKLKTLKGIYLNKEYEQPPIEINHNHLYCMSNSLKVLFYQESQIIFREKCHKAFEQLRYLVVPSNVLDLPMEFEKFEHLTYYWGPFTQGMNFYELPPSLRYMYIEGSSQNEVAYSRIPPKVTPASSLVQLGLYDFKSMQRLPDGVEKLTKLQHLSLLDYNELKELPSEFEQLRNLESLYLSKCHKLKELPSGFGQLSNLTTLKIHTCSTLSVLPPSFGHLISLKDLGLSNCSCLKKLPSNFGQLKNLEKLDLSYSSGLEELPLDFGQLKSLKELDVSHCYGLEEWPLSYRGLRKMKKIVLKGCSLKLIESLPHNIRGNYSILIDEEFDEESD